MVKRDIVVTLVHGTWAREATWTDLSSPFCQQLQAKTPRLREILVYRWSGRNSQKARLTAADGLTEHAKTVKARYPEAKHYIIAHSHGGNVALYACGNEEFRRNVAGIACLSTPFIRERRDWFELGGTDALVWTGFVLALVWLVINACFLLFSVFVWKPHIAVRLLTYACVLALFFVVAWGAVLRVLGVLFGVLTPPFWYVPDTTFVLTDEGFYKEIERDVNLLIIRSAGDEATAALSAMRFASWLVGTASSAVVPIILSPTRLLNPILKIRNEPILWTIVVTVDIVCFIGMLLWALLSTASLGWSVFWPDYISQFHPIERLASFSVLSVIAWSILLFAAPVLIAGLITVLLAVVTAICRMPFGFLSGLEPFGAQLSVESTPTGGYFVHHLRESSDGSTGLAHSDPYSQPEAIELIVKWLRSNLRTKSHRSGRRFVDE